MRSPRSLGRWLSWWLAVQTFIGLGLVCIIVYVATSLNFSARQDEELRHKQEVIRHLVAEIVTQDDLVILRHKLDDFFFGHTDLRLRLVSNAGTVIYGATPADKSPEHQRRIAFDILSPWSRTTVLRAEMVLDTEADAELMRRLAWTLLASALGGAVIVSAGGAWLVRRALAPLHDLAQQAAALAPENIGQSLDGSAQADELQPLIAQFNALLARLENAYQQLEGFNADVAHELRTPLATLIGETELALSRERSTGELREVLGSNLEDLNRLAGLVNDMLFLSKADRGERARRNPVGSLAELAAEVVEFHDAVLQEAGVRVRVRGDAAGAFDAGLLRRALSNISRGYSTAFTVWILLANMARRTTVSVCRSSRRSRACMEDGHLRCRRQAGRPLASVYQRRTADPRGRAGMPAHEIRTLNAIIRLALLSIAQPAF
jgi:two-component system heavy metal sensor histidine kinase CusS